MLSTIFFKTENLISLLNNRAFFGPVFFFKGRKTKGLFQFIL